jgi:hypothetical protein
MQSRTFRINYASDRPCLPCPRNESQTQKKGNQSESERAIKTQFHFFLSTPPSPALSSGTIARHNHKRRRNGTRIIIMRRSSGELTKGHAIRGQKKKVISFILVRSKKRRRRARSPQVAWKEKRNNREIVFRHHS